MSTPTRRGRACKVAAAAVLLYAGASTSRADFTSGVDGTAGGRSPALLHYMVNGETHSGQRDYSNAPDTHTRSAYWIELSRGAYLEFASAASVEVVSSPGVSEGTPNAGAGSASDRDDANTLNTTQGTPARRNNFGSPAAARPRGAGRFFPRKPADVASDVTRLVESTVEPVAIAAPLADVSTLLVPEVLAVLPPKETVAPQGVETETTTITTKGDDVIRTAALPVPGGLVLAAVGIAAVAGMRKRFTRR